MNNKIIVTYDKSNEDISTLCVAHESMNFLSFNSSLDITKIITGKEADELWRKLTLKKEEFMPEVQQKPSYYEIYNEALCKLCLETSEVEDFRPASEMFIDELKREIPNAIIIWLKTGETIVYIKSSKENKT